MRLHFITTTLLLSAVTMVPAWATPLEDRLREQLQSTVTQLREAQGRQASLEAAKTAAKPFKRKAVLFSLISVLFAILFITLFSQSFNTLYEDRIPGSNIRIKVMDTYTRNFERYIGESIKISTYKALNNITIYNREHNSNRFFIDSQEFNDTFENCMICGYIRPPSARKVPDPAGHWPPPTQWCALEP